MHRKDEITLLTRDNGASVWAAIAGRLDDSNTTHHMLRKGRRFVCVPEVLKRNWIQSRVTIFGLGQGGIFPQAVKVGPNTAGVPGDDFEVWLEAPTTRGR